MGSETKMMVQYKRSGGRTPPADREYLHIDEGGQFTMWRSVNVPVVGRFAGKLALDEMKQLRDEVAAAKQARSLQRTPEPDSAIETITIGQITASLGHPDQPEGAWGKLITHLRNLLDSRIDAPLAAIALEVEPEAQAARLVHRGEEPIKVQLQSLSIQAVLWGGYYEMRGNWQTTMSGGTAPVTAEPGWSLDLAYDHGFNMGQGEVVHTYARFTLYDGEGIVNVSVVDAPPLVLDQSKN